VPMAAGVVAGDLEVVEAVLSDVRAAAWERGLALTGAQILL